MVRTTSKTEKLPVATMPAAATENVVVEKTSKPRAKKPKAEAAPAAASAAPATASGPVVEGAEALDCTLAVKMSEFAAKMQQLSSLFATIRGDFKTLEKLTSRELKNAQKSSSKKKKSNVNRQPSGFVKPTLISDELAKFLGKSAGTEMARTEVSKEINGYIRSKGLQDPANGRKINPDLNLAKLLNIKSGDELTYFNLQRYMKHHFIKTIPAVPAPVATA